MPENPSVRPPWKLPILFPLWTMQMLLAVLFLGGVPIICSQSPGVDFRTWLIMIYAFLSLIMNMAEIALFTQHKLSTRIYVISQWAKATIILVVWVIMFIMLYLPDTKWARVGDYAVTEFMLQHPAVLASVYYGGRAYSKYGDVGAEGSGDERETNDEETPLLS